MAAIQDFLKANVTPGKIIGFGATAALTAPSEIAKIATGERVFTNIGKAFATIYFWSAKWLAPMRQALVGGWMVLGFQAITKAIQNIVVGTGSLTAALERLRTIQSFERMFAPLVGGLGAARQRVSELLALSARGPFKFEEVATASRNLEVFTRGVLSGTNATRMIGQVAISTGNGITEVSDAVGQFYSTLRDGRPIEGSVEQLRQMGIISQATATQLLAMASGGSTSIDMFNTFTAAIADTSKSLKGYKDDVATVTAEHEKAVEALKAGFGAPFTEAEVQRTKNMTAVTRAMTPSLEAVAKSLAVVVTAGSTFRSFLLRTVSESSLAKTAVESFGKIISGLMIIMAAATPVLLAFAIKGFVGITTGIASKAALGLVSALRAMGFQAVISGGAIATAGRAAAIAATGFRIAGVALMATGIVAGIAAAGGIILNLYNGYRKSVEAAKELAEESRKTNAALREQISHITTLAEAHEALTAAIEAQIEAQVKFNEVMLKGDPRQTRAALQAVEAAKKTAEAAAKVSPQGLLGPGLEQLTQQRARQRITREEQIFNEALSKASPAGRVQLIQTRSKELQARAEAGFRGQQVRVDVETQKAELTTRQEQAKGRVKAAQQALRTGGGNLTPEETKSIEEQFRATGRAGLPAIAKRVEQLQRGKKQAAQAEVEQLGAQIAGVGRQKEFKGTAEAAEAEQERLRAAISAGDAKERGDKKTLEAQKLISGGEVTVGEAAREQVRQKILLLEVEKQYLIALREGAVTEEDRANQLRAQAEEEQRVLNISNLRATAELEIARARGTPAEVARKAFEVQQRALEDELAENQRSRAAEVKRLQDQIDAEKAKPQTAETGAVISELEVAKQAAGVRDDDRTKEIQARLEEGRRNEMERQRDIEITRQQEDIEERIAETKLTGNVRERQALEDQRAFLSKYEELRGKFGAQEAAQRALEARRTELIEQMPETPQVVASSLARIGGGGGVAGPTGDPMIRIQERMRNLQQTYLPKLQDIDNKIAGKLGLPAPTTPPATAPTAGAAPAPGAAPGAGAPPAAPGAPPVAPPPGAPPAAAPPPPEAPQPATAPAAAATPKLSEEEFTARKAKISELKEQLKSLPGVSAGTKPEEEAAIRNKAKKIQTEIDKLATPPPTAAPTVAERHATYEQLAAGRAAFIAKGKADVQEYREQSPVQRGAEATEKIYGTTARPTQEMMPAWMIAQKYGEAGNINTQAAGGSASAGGAASSLEQIHVAPTVVGKEGVQLGPMKGLSLGGEKPSLQSEMLSTLKVISRSTNKSVDHLGEIAEKPAGVL